MLLVFHPACGIPYCLAPEDEEELLKYYEDIWKLEYDPDNAGGSGGAGDATGKGMIRIALKILNLMPFPLIAVCQKTP